MKSKRFIIIVLVSLMLMTVSLAGCASSQQSTATSQKQIVIGVTMDELQNDFWVAAKKGMDQAAAANGIKLVYEIANGDAVKQNAQIQDLIAQHVNAIVVVYVDATAILQGVKAANAAHIPIVFCDRPIDNTTDAKADWGVTTDSTVLTQNGWNWMIQYARTNQIHLKVLELEGSLNDNNAIERTNVTAQVMKDNSDIAELVQAVPTDYDPEKALAGVTNALQAHPEINCIFMHYDGLAPAIESALQQAGRWKKIGEPGHIIIMPYSGNESGIKEMMDKYAEMCFGMDVAQEGYKSVEGAMKLAEGQQVGPPLDLPGFIITQANFAQLGPTAYGYPAALKAEGQQ
jgi:ABC-type sugar transport system substrate-binding protein